GRFVHRPLFGAQVPIRPARRGALAEGGGDVGPALRVAEQHRGRTRVPVRQLAQHVDRVALAVTGRPGHTTTNGSVRARRTTSRWAGLSGSGDRTSPSSTVDCPMWTVPSYAAASAVASRPGRAAQASSV